MPGAFDDVPGRRDGLPYGGPFGDAGDDGPSGGFSDVPGSSGLRTLFSLQQEAGGLASLPSDLAIASQTVSADLFYQAKDATTSTWTGTGGTLTGAGSGGTVGLDSPTAHADDRAADCEATRFWRASDNAVGDIATEDVVVEVVFYVNTAGNAVIVGKLNGLQGWFCNVQPTVVKLTLGDGGFTAVNSSALTPNSWNHAICFVDRSGSAQWYVNGAVSGSPTVVSGVGSITLADDVEIGALNGASIYPDKIAHVAMWKQAAWLDSHLQAAVARERYARAFGFYSAQTTLQADARASAAYLDKASHVDGIKRLHYVGSGVHRLVRRYDKHLRVGSGYLSEAAATNLCLQSEDFSTTWTATRATVSTNTAVAPNGETTADTLVEDATAADSHVLGQNIGGLTASNQYCLSVWCKASNRTWMRIAVDTKTQDFDLSNGAVGTNSGMDDAAMEYWGNGWYRCWIVFTLSAGTNTIYYIAAGEADNDAIYDGLSQDSIYVWGAQFENGTKPTSYIPTTTGTVTRVADLVKYQAASAIAQGTFAMDVLLPDYTPTLYERLGSLSDDGVNNEVVHILNVQGGDLQGGIRYIVRDGGSSQCLIRGDTQDLTDDSWHEVRGTFAANDFHAYVDGTEEGTEDTAGTIPAGLDIITLGDDATQLEALKTGVIGNPRIFSSPTIKSITDFGDIMSYAGAYVSSAAAATLNASTYTALGGTFTEIGASDFTVSAAGLFTYTGTTTKKFLVATGLSLSADSAMDPVEIAVLKNGSVSTSSEAERKNPINDIGRMAINDLVELANGDTVQLAARADTGTPDLTAEKATITIAEVS